MSGMAETSAWWVTYNAGSSGRTRKNNGPNPITAYVPSLHDPPPDCFGALEKAKASPAYARELEAQREKIRQLHAARKMNSSWQQLDGAGVPVVAHLMGSARTARTLDPRQASAVAAAKAEAARAEADAEARCALRCAIGNGLAADVWPRFVARFGVGRVVEFYASTEVRACPLSLSRG